MKERRVAAEQTIPGFHVLCWCCQRPSDTGGQPNRLAGVYRDMRGPQGCRRIALLLLIGKPTASVKRGLTTKSAENAKGEAGVQPTRSAEIPKLKSERFNHRGVTAKEA